MKLDARKLNILSNILSYHKHFLEDYHWEDTQYYKRYNSALSPDDFIQMSLKIGAGLALNEYERELLTEITANWDDNFSSNDYREHDEDELAIYFAGFEPPSGADVDKIIQEALSGKEPEPETSPTCLIKPSYIDTTKHFFGAFNNAEREVSANWIVRFCYQRNKDSWEHFWLSDLQSFYEESLPGQRFLLNGLDEIYLDKPKYGIEVDCGGEGVIIHDKFVVTCYQSAWKA